MTIINRRAMLDHESGHAMKAWSVVRRDGRKGVDIRNEREALCFGILWRYQSEQKVEAFSPSRRHDRLAILKNISPRVSF